MSGKAFSKVLRGLEESKAYLDGERDGYKVTVPPTVDVKSIRKGLRMTQAAFSDSFGFSLDAVKHWEGGRRTPEVPARAYLTVIQRNPEAVLEALRPAAASSQRVQVVLGPDSSTVKRVGMAAAPEVGDVKKRPRRTKIMGRGDRNSLNTHSIRGKQGIVHENRQLEG